MRVTPTRPLYPLVSYLLAVLLSAASLFAACGDRTANTQCVPVCDGRQCGDDGCGGACGACDTADVCSSDGLCVAGGAGCDASCADLGLTCGEHCGVSCGTCGEGTWCTDGACVCDPDCRDKACGASDGCGGTCGPCAADENCADCLLRAYVVDKEYEDGVLTWVTVAIDYTPPADAELPGIADLRLDIQGPGVLERVGMGEALLDADKELHVDKATGQAFRTLPDGPLQTLVLSTKSKARIKAGRWLAYRFRLGTAERPAKVPVAISIVAREAIFAPPKADEALWGQSFSDPVSIWPETQGASTPGADAAPEEGAGD